MTNEFKPFAVDVGANVDTQGDYASSSILADGFVAGIAPSKTMNKALRQSSVIAHAVAQVCSDVNSIDSPDDGDMAHAKLRVAAQFASVGSFSVIQFVGVNDDIQIHDTEDRYYSNVWSISQSGVVSSVMSLVVVRDTFTSHEFTKIILNNTAKTLELGHLDVGNAFILDVTIAPNEYCMVFYNGEWSKLFTDTPPVAPTPSTYLNSRPVSPVEGDMVIYTSIGVASASYAWGSGTWICISEQYVSGSWRPVGLYFG